MAFEAAGQSAGRLVLDAHPDFGGVGAGVSPVEALLASAAACSGIDVLSILEKKRQTVTSYRIEVDGEQPAPGTWPRKFSSITLRHVLKGPNLDPVAVARAVELSDAKYCTVVATLRAAPTVVSEWRIE